MLSDKCRECGGGTVTKWRQKSKRKSYSSLYLTFIIALIDLMTMASAIFRLIIRQQRTQHWVVVDVVRVNAALAMLLASGDQSVGGVPNVGRITARLRTGEPVHHVVFKYFSFTVILCICGKFEFYFLFTMKLCNCGMIEFFSYSL